MARRKQSHISTQGERMEQTKLTDEELSNLAWNAIDTQNEALAKLEYFLTSHHGYLYNYFQEVGETDSTKAELYGFWLSAESLVKELKESANIISKGVQQWKK